jgi:hypothetical protein
MANIPSQTSKFNCVTTMNFHFIVNSVEAGKIHAIVKYLDYFSYKLLLLFQVYFKIYREDKVDKFSDVFLIRIMGYLPLVICY